MSHGTLLIRNRLYIPQPVNGSFGAQPIQVAKPGPEGHVMVDQTVPGSGFSGLGICVIGNLIGSLTGHLTLGAMPIPCRSADIKR